MAAVRAELDRLLADSNEGTLRRPNVEGSWSCADVLAHFAGYTRGVADLIADDRGIQNAAPPYKAAPDLDDDAFNAIVVDYWRKRPIEEMLAEERAAFQALADEVAQVSRDDLLAAGRFKFARGRPLLAILPAQSYGHYRDHMPALRRGLSGQGKDRTEA